MTGLIYKGHKDYDLPNNVQPFEGIHITAKELSELGFLKGDKLRIEFKEIV